MLMVVALFAVIALIGGFQSSNFKSQIALLLGAETPTTDKSLWKWCPPEVTEIQHLPSQTVVKDADSLKALCKVSIRPSSSEEIKKSTFVPLLRAESPGATLIVEAGISQGISQSDLFRISGLAFHSKHLRIQLDKIFAIQSKSN
jgi:hypothetical protein